MIGLLGHLGELCSGSGVSAEVWLDAVPRIEGVEEYIAEGAVPGGTKRNWASYGHQVEELDEAVRFLLCDPQTSGGLLVAVDPAAQQDFLRLTQNKGLELQPIGEVTTRHEFLVQVQGDSSR